jgi:hypothetical protein
MDEARERMGELLRLPFVAFVVLIILGGTLSAGEKAAKAAAKPVKAAKAEAAPDVSGDSSKAAPIEGDAAADAAGPAVKLADFWILTFRFQKLAMIQPTDGIHRGEQYWYMLYQVENGTKADRSAYISVTARSNKNKTYANMYLPEVESLIERKAGKPLWGKADAYRAVVDAKADAKAGMNYSVFEDKKARDCVAIFNQLDPLATKITVTIEGLSNDIRMIERENAGRQIESRVYVLEFERPGDEYEMNLDQFHLIRHYWMKKVTDLDAAKDGAKAKSK